MRNRFLILKLIIFCSMICIRENIYNVITNNWDTAKHIMSSSNAIPHQTNTNIYFMKVKKTGSTTLYGILSRYAIHYNKRVVTYCMNTRPYMQPNNTQGIVQLIIPPLKIGFNRKFNILIDHSFFDHAAIQQVIESPIKCITMLRKPIDMLRSWLYFKGLGRKKNKTGSTHCTKYHDMLHSIY